MKWLFFLLLAANLVFGFYVYLKEQAPNADAQLMQAQLNADQIRIVPPPEKKPGPPGPVAQGAASQPVACVEWGTFGGGEVARAQAAIDRLALGERVRRIEVAVTVDYWVYIPPLKTRAEMDRKVNELANLGIAEYYPVLDPGRWRHAISLGIFRSEDGAKKFLAGLRKKGVRSAVVGNREQRVSQSAFLVKEPTVEESAGLVVLKSDFAGTDLRAMECPAG
jgi:hypothetical protein